MDEWTKTNLKDCINVDECLSGDKVSDIVELLFMRRRDLIRTWEDQTT